MKHVIFAGCSFSDDGALSDDFDKSQYSKSMNLNDLRYPVSVKIHQLLTFDLITQNVDDVVIHTIARGSFGNHIIFEKLKSKIYEIKENHRDAEIFAVVQLTAFAREGVKSLPWIEISKYPYDYPTKNLNYFNFKEIKNFFEVHLDNLISMRNFLQDQDVTHNFYFGWANIFTEDIIAYDLQNKMDELKNFINFYEYTNTIDEIGVYCAGKKIVTDKINEDKIFENLYKIRPDRFGGLIEYGRDNLKLGERYHLIFDPHPSSKTYYIYYKNVLRDWFFKVGVTKEKNEMDSHFLQLLDKIFEFEYTRFISTLKTKNTDYVEIDHLSFNLIKTEKFLDKNYTSEQFNKLQNKLRIL
jgi:hypothetical protein